MVANNNSLLCKLQLSGKITQQLMAFKYLTLEVTSDRKSERGS